MSRRSTCSECRQSLIAEHGAVSEPVAEAMANGMARVAGDRSRLSASPA